MPLLNGRLVYSAKHGRHEARLREMVKEYSFVSMIDIEGRLIPVQNNRQIENKVEEVWKG